MRENSNQSLDNLLQTVTKSKLPVWAKTTISVSLGVTPLLEVLVPLVIAKLIADLVLKLLGF